jgi:AraC-like DNA-binding protein
MIKINVELVKDLSLLVNAVGAGNCFLLSYVYLRKKERNLQRPEPILALLFFILGAIILNTIFNFSGYSPLFYGFEPLTNALAFAIAPLLFLYVRALHRPTVHLGLRSGHLAHFYTYLLLTIIALWAPQSSLGSLGQTLMQSEFIRILWNLHFLCYLILIAREFRKLDKSRWRVPGILVWGIGSIWFFNLLFYLHRILIKPLPILVYLNITLLFSAMTLWLFYQKLGVAGPGNRKKTVKKKQSKGLALSTANDPILMALSENKYYRNPNLDIRTFSEALQIPYHELSTWINQEYHQNFNEFINSFRVQEVVQALDTQQHQSYTILGLAQKAGFKSASAFYAAFKKEKGTTPTLYIAQLAKAQ